MPLYTGLLRTVNEYIMNEWRGCSLSLEVLQNVTKEMYLWNGLKSKFFELFCQLQIFFDNKYPGKTPDLDSVNQDPRHTTEYNFNI
jgi:hypothetical protein